MYGLLPELSTTDGKTVNGFPVAILNPPKTAVLRLPNDQELMERFAKQLTIQRDMGRGKTHSTQAPTLEADLNMFRKVRIDRSEVEFDEYEAQEAINKLLSCWVSDSTRDGQKFVITLETTFGPTTHTLHPPTSRDMYRYREQIIDQKNAGRNLTHLRYRHQVAITLYDAVFDSAEGYADSFPVPANHKFAVALELANLVDESSQPVDPNS